MEWYVHLREFGERLASWPLLGVAVLFLVRLVTTSVPRGVAIMMGGVCLSMIGGWTQRLPFATREWACRTFGLDACSIINGLHPLSILGLYLIALGALLHYRAALYADGWYRWFAAAVLAISIVLSVVPGLADAVYRILWPLISSIAVTR